MKRQNDHAIPSSSIKRKRPTSSVTHLRVVRAALPDDTGDFSEPLGYAPYFPSADVSYTFDAGLCKSCDELLAKVFAGWETATLSCKHEGSGSASSYSVEPHHDNTVEYLISSSATCRLCKLMAQELGSFQEYPNCYTINEHSINRTHWLYYQISIEENSPGTFWLAPRDRRGGTVFKPHFRLYQKHQVSSPKPRGYDAAKFVWKQPAADAMLMAPVPDIYPSTAEAVRQVREWLDRCEKDTSHTICARTRLHIGLPKRVLDIKTADDTVYLYESEGEITPYATLSYCWGTGVPLKTTTENVAQHRNGIALSAFPETLKDAVVFSKSLGFNYLWIDALCIVQDDPSDWTTQAAAMTSIYHGCSLNIAFVDAAGCDTGAVRKMQNYSVRIGTSSKPSEPQGSAETYIFCGTTFRQGAYQMERKNRLSTRAWAFQETLVSVATVYVSHSGLSWECCSETCIENEKPDSCSTFGHPTIHLTEKASWADHNGEIPDTVSRYRDYNYNWLSDEEKRLQTLRSLYGWVAKLSTRRLTYPSDKLPSIAGLASKVATTSYATYVAGLWEEDLPVGLSWSAVSVGSLTRVNGRAPSWSWASVDGDLQYMWCLLPNSKFLPSVYKNEELDLQVLDVSIEEKNPGTYGEVTNGRIEAIGWMQQGTIRLEPEEHAFHINFDVCYASDFEYTLDDCDEFSEDAPMPRICWLLRLTSVAAKGASEQRRGPYMCFLLLTSAGTREDEFRRIGFAQVDGNWPKRRPFGLKRPNHEIDLFEAGERKRITLI